MDAFFEWLNSAKHYTSTYTHIRALIRDSPKNPYLVNMLVFFRQNKVGEGIGDKALLQGAPRAATIVVNKPSIFLRIEKEDYDKFMKEANKKEEDWKINEIDKFSIFSKNVRRFKQDMLHQVQFVDAHVNHIVFNEKDPVDYVYFITSGEYEMTKFLYENKQNSLFKKVGSMVKISLNYETVVVKESTHDTKESSTEIF